MSKVTYKMEGNKNNAFTTAADDIDGKFISKEPFSISKGIETFEKLPEKTE
jgi:hypothetical protein